MRGLNITDSKKVKKFDPLDENKWLLSTSTFYPQYEFRVIEWLTFTFHNLFNNAHHRNEEQEYE